MSSIDKLLIQGIRCFGAGDTEKAVIQFGTPLTLITGQNGAGKTASIQRLCQL
jgi:DNA repair protein RAD50